MRVEEGTLRPLYNREPLSAWTTVSEPAHVEACLRDAEKLLDAAEIQIDALAPALLTAYDFLAARTDGLNLGSRRVATEGLAGGPGCAGPRGDQGTQAEGRGGGRADAALGAAV